MKINFTIRANKQLEEPYHSLLGYYVSPIGPLKVIENSKRIHSIDFVQDVVDSKINMLPLLHVAGTAFQIAVWEEVIKVPVGTVITYEQLAQAIGKPKAVRAVANALAQNSIAYFIPCHRVIRKDGSLGGYKWGIDRKRALLEYENVPLRGAVRQNG